MTKINTNTECVFCKVISGDLPSKQVYSDDEFVVFEDIHPKAPKHVLIVPKEHIETINDLDETNSGLMAKAAIVAQKVARDLGIKEGYQLHVNVGKKAGQIVFHLHIHLLGGWNKPQDF